MANSIFSRYRQGENRVTATVLAVFEQLGMEAVEFLLSTAVEGGDQTLELVRYRNQPTGTGDGVPDAQIRASFNLLFETKVVPGTVDGRQLDRHLEAFDGGSVSMERLYVLSPDVVIPEAVHDVGDERVRWMSFAGLSQAIDEYVAATARVLSDRDLFLLRQLQQFFTEEGLVSSPGDVVVVPAGSAWGEYLEFSAYICQPGRSFREVDHMGFYRKKHIEALVPAILYVRDHVEFSVDSIASLRSRSEPHDRDLADLIERLVRNSGRREVGADYKVFLLSAPDADRTIRLPAAIPHLRSGAWTQGQRYVSLEGLESARTTGDL